MLSDESKKSYDFYSRPCGRGDLRGEDGWSCRMSDFYSRPCGRGDSEPNYHIGDILTFLLTPLREGRP